MFSVVYLMFSAVCLIFVGDFQFMNVEIVMIVKPKNLLLKIGSQIVNLKMLIMNNNKLIGLTLVTVSYRLMMEQSISIFNDTRKLFITINYLNTIIISVLELHI